MQDHRDNSDVSLKEVFHKLSRYAMYLWRNATKIILAGFGIGLLFLVLNINKQDVYKAELTFMLNEDSRGGLGSFGNILGQFGLGLSGPETNLDKIMELSKSRQIAQYAFFDTLRIDGRPDYLANHLVDHFESWGKWERDGLFSFNDDDSLSLEGFRFENAQVDSFTLRESKALKRLHGILVGSPDTDPLFESRYNELSGIMTLSMKSASEDLSIAVVNSLFEKLSRFYIEKATEKQEYEFRIIKNKYDSIQNRLNSVQYNLAEFQDRYQNLFRRKDELKEKQLRTEEQKLLLMTGEAEKQLQLASLALDNKTPFIQLIDRPLKPLKPLNPSLATCILLGFLTGIVLATFYLIGRKAINEILNS